MSNLQHIYMPVILTSCTFQFLSIDHPWKPVCKRRREGRDETQIFIVCRLWEFLMFIYPGDTTALCWREKCSLLSLSLHCWLHLLFKSSWIQQFLILSLLLPPGAMARHRDKLVNTSRSATRLCTFETSFDAFWKKKKKILVASLLWRLSKIPISIL